MDMISWVGKCGDREGKSCSDGVVLVWGGCVETYWVGNKDEGGCMSTGVQIWEYKIFMMADKFN
jgi:hypothetical protein